MGEVWIKITPNDTLFFGTGRPFTMGSDTWTDLKFPPSPSQFFGAIVSYILARKGIDFNDVDKVREIEEKLEIYGPFLYDGEFLFPTPKDLVREKKKNGKILKLSIEEHSKNGIKKFFSDYPFSHILVNKSSQQVEEIEYDNFIKSFSLEDYLENKDGFVLSKSPYVVENKVGIKLDKNKRASEEGYLYRIPLIRLDKKISFVLRVESDDDEILGILKERGIIKLGGEGKTAVLENFGGDTSFFTRSRNGNFNFFKLYFATPTIFKKGVIPDGVNNNLWLCNGVEVKLLAIAMDRYEISTGWDMRENRPKSTLKVVPAGSVYYFEIQKGNFADVFRTFNFKKICDYTEYSRRGFGVCFVGGVSL